MATAMGVVGTGIVLAATTFPNMEEPMIVRVVFGLWLVSAVLVTVHNVERLLWRIEVTEDSLRITSPLRQRTISRDEVVAIHVRWLGEFGPWFWEGLARVTTRKGRVWVAFSRPRTWDRDGAIAHAWPELLRAGPPL